MLNVSFRLQWNNGVCSSAIRECVEQTACISAVAHETGWSVGICPARSVFIKTKVPSSHTPYTSGLYPAVETRWSILSIYYFLQQYSLIDKSSTFSISKSPLRRGFKSGRDLPIESPNNKSLISKNTPSISGFLTQSYWKWGASQILILSRAMPEKSLLKCFHYANRYDVDVDKYFFTGTPTWMFMYLVCLCTVDLMGEVVTIWNFPRSINYLYQRVFVNTVKQILSYVW